jgi:hypothetical protein
MVKAIIGTLGIVVVDHPAVPSALRLAGRKLRFKKSRVSACSTVFLRHLLSAFCDLIINFLDFQGEMNVVRMLCVSLEQQISFGFQLIPLFLPNSRGR